VAKVCTNSHRERAREATGSLKLSWYHICPSEKSLNIENDKIASKGSRELHECRYFDVVCRSNFVQTMHSENPVVGSARSRQLGMDAIGS